MNFEHLFLSALGIVNLFSFVVMAYDKRQSMQGRNVDRVSEGLIFFMATCFGSVGVYASMLVFRHKTRKWYFHIGIPLLILQNFATLYLLRDALISTP